MTNPFAPAAVADTALAVNSTPTSTVVDPASTGAVAGLQTPVPANGVASPAPFIEQTFDSAPQMSQAQGYFSAHKSGQGIGSVGSGAIGGWITQFVNKLCLIKPTEYIPEKMTQKGMARNVIMCDLAVLDDEEEPGRIVRNVYIMKKVLAREAKKILDSPDPYFVARILKTKTNSGNDLYMYELATEEHLELARQFLEVRKL